MTTTRFKVEDRTKPFDEDAGCYPPLEFVHDNKSVEGYTLAGECSPSGTIGHIPKGQSYRLYDPHRAGHSEGFELLAYPETKEYYLSYVA